MTRRQPIDISPKNTACRRAPGPACARQSPRRCGKTRCLRRHFPPSAPVRAHHYKRLPFARDRCSGSRSHQGRGHGSRVQSCSPPTAKRDRLAKLPSRFQTDKTAGHRAKATAGQEEEACDDGGTRRGTAFRRSLNGGGGLGQIGALRGEFAVEKARRFLPERMIRDGGDAGPDNVRILRVTGESMEPETGEGDRYLVGTARLGPATGEMFVPMGRERAHGQADRECAQRRSTPASADNRLTGVHRLHLRSARRSCIRQGAVDREACLTRPVIVTRFRAEFLTGRHNGRKAVRRQPRCLQSCYLPPAALSVSSGKSRIDVAAGSRISRNCRMKSPAALATIGERDRAQNQTCPRSMMLCLAGASLAPLFRSPSMLRLIAGPTRKRLPMR